MLEGLAGGDIDIVVGTHAVIGESVVFSDLGLGVIDEQHRYGQPDMCMQCSYLYSTHHSFQHCTGGS